jgi:branched-chain amino acid transport system substrate-binding protein
MRWRSRRKARLDADCDCGRGGRGYPATVHPRTSFARALLAAVIAGAGLAACGNAGNSVSNTGNVEGVTAHKIVVGGIASLTGPISADFAPVFDGVRAYFDMVNASGGINGRTIDFADGLDDGSSPEQDTVQARALVSDHVFAVVGVGTPSFAGASYLAANDVPTFGYNINPEWSDGPSLFGSEGSFIDFEHPGPEPAYLAEQVHARRVGLISYNVKQSQEGCIGIANTMKKFHIPVAFEDLSISPPAGDLSADVTRMRADHVDFVASCLDLAGNLVLSRTLRGEGMSSVTQYWLDGYDEQAVAQNASLMNGVYFLTGHVPYESGAAEPSKYPAMATYLRELKKYYPGDQPGEASLAGWVSAAMFATGLRMIGKQVTRQRLINAVNSLTHYTAGIVAPIDWRVDHHASGSTDCNVFLQVRHGHFVPLFGSKRTVFTCFQYPQPSSRHVIVVRPPPDIPGG